MKKSIQLTVATITIILAFSIGLFVGTKTQTSQEKAFQNEVTSLRHESKRISELDNYEEFPEYYQREQIKKLDKFVKEHKNLTANELYTVQGLTYENCDAYQEYWFTEH